jgi:hypothetical protein
MNEVTLAKKRCKLKILDVLKIAVVDFCCKTRTFCNFWVQVTNAVDHVKAGTDALQIAKSLQKRSRKCMMIAIILLLLIAIIVVLSILQPWKK